MYFNNKTTLRMLRAVILCAVSTFMFCAEYNNPVDPDFGGDYDFEVTDFPTNNSFELFKSYNFNIKNKGNDVFHSYEYNLPEKNASLADIQINNPVVTLYFKDTCTGTLQVIGIRPNKKQVVKSFNFNVINPFSIIGDSIVEIGGTCSFKIKNPAITTIKNPVVWSYNGKTESLPLGSQLYVKSDSASTITIKAQLYDFKGNSVTLSKLVTFRGFRPTIHQISILDYNKAEKDSIPLGDSFYVSIRVSDKDNNPLYLSLLRIDTLLPSETLLHSDTCYAPDTTYIFLMPPMEDTVRDSFNVVLIDSTGLDDGSSFSVPVIWTPATVTLSIPKEVPFNAKSTFTIKSERGVTFNWYIKDSLGSTVRSAENRKTLDFILEPLNTEGRFTVTVTPYDKSHLPGDSATDTFYSKDIPYFLNFTTQSAYEYDTIKIGETFACSVFTTFKNEKLTSGVHYIWNFTPSPEMLNQYLSSGIKYAIDNSAIEMTFKDSIPTEFGHIFLNVRGVIGEKESTQLLSRKLVVRKFLPTCSLATSHETGYLKDSVRYEIQASTTDPRSPGVMIYYRKAPDTTWFACSSVVKIYFTSTGLQTIHFKAIDMGSKLSSNTVSETIDIVSNDPSISIDNPALHAVVNDSFSLNAIKSKPAHGSSHAIVTTYWDLDYDGIFEDSTAPAEMQPSFTGTVVGPDTIAVYCKDARGVVSDTQKIEIIVHSDIPTIKAVTIPVDSYYVNRDVQFIITTKDPDNARLFAQIDTNGTLFTTDTIDTGTYIIKRKFVSGGTYSVQVYVRDTEKHPSIVYTIPESLFIDQGIPSIDSTVRSDKLPKYINDAVAFVLLARDNDSITSRFYTLDTSLQPIPISFDTFHITAPSTPGTFTLYTKVSDGDGNSSTWYATPFTVLEGRPVVENVTCKNDIYIHQTDTFHIHIRDINGYIRTLDYRSSSDTVIKTIDITKDTNDTIIKIPHTYDTSEIGTMFFYFRAHDEDGLISEWKACLVLVKKGEPVITGVQVKNLNYNNKDTIFILDTIQFTIRTTDPNPSGQLRVRASWNGTAFTDSSIVRSTDSIAVIKYIFSRLDTAITQIRFSVVDSDGFSSDSLYQLKVLSGAPVIDSLKPLKTWIFDDSVYTIFSHDMNDTVQKWYFDFNNDGVWERNGVTHDTIVYRFLSDGTKTVKIGVEDNNGLLTTKTYTIIVNLGGPLVWVGENTLDDTLFVKCSEGVGSYNLNVNSSDSNGSITRYFWNLSSFGDTTKSINKTATGIYPNYPISILNSAFQMSVSCIDNDGIMGIGTFWVYPDGPPPAPTLLLPAHNSFTDTSKQITLTWSGEDVHDGSATEYALIWENGNSSPSDTLVNFSKGSSGAYTSNGSQYSYTFKVSVNGIYYWQVIARDQRGSTGKSTVRAIGVTN